MPTYVITGTNRGLGLEWVRQLSSIKENVVVAVVRSLTPPPTDLITLKEGAKGAIHVLECDTGKTASIADFPQRLAAVPGLENVKIDVLINNAGINAVPDETSLDLDADDLAKHISVNVYGPAKLVVALLPHLKHGSVVVNLSSGLGSLTATRGPKDNAPPPAKCTPYSISKAALNMLTVHQASGLKEKGIAVISIDPGWVKTRMGGEGAILEPEESISGMRKVLEKLDSSTTGRFYRYDGTELGW